MFRMTVATVRFAPGARTAWHSHARGQYLSVTQGTALCGTRDGHVVAAHPGRGESGPWAALLGSLDGWCQGSMKMHSPGHSSADSITASSLLSGMLAIPSAPCGLPFAVA